VLVLEDLPVQVLGVDMIVPHMRPTAVEKRFLLAY
jgi:hypothetical protein